MMRGGVGGLFYVETSVQVEVGSATKFTESVGT